MSHKKNPLPEQALAPTPAATAPVDDLNPTVDADVLAGTLKKLIACGDRYAAINDRERTEGTAQEQLRVWIADLRAVIDMCWEIELPKSAAPLERILLPMAAAAPLWHLMGALKDIEHGVVSAALKPLKPAKGDPRSRSRSRWEARAWLALAMEIRCRLDGDRGKAAQALEDDVPECGAFLAARGRKDARRATSISTVERIINNYETFKTGDKGGAAIGTRDGFHMQNFALGLRHLDARQKSLSPPDFQRLAETRYRTALQFARDDMRREPWA